MTNTKSSLVNSYLHLHLLVILWGFTAILGKLISIPSVEIVFYRTLFSFVLMFVVVQFRRGSLDVGKKGFIKFFWTGGIIAVHWVLFFLAAKVSNISICLAGMATTSLWTSIIEPIVLKRKIKAYEPILGIVALIGISVVFEAVIDEYLGFLIAVMSAVLSAVFTVINGRLVKKCDHYVISFYQMLGACFCTLPFMLIYSFLITNEGVRLSLDWSDFTYLIILSLVCTVYAYSNSLKLMHKLSAFAINLTVNLEPVYGIVLAVFIFGNSEYMGTSFYWGTFIILLSVLLYPVMSYYGRKNH